MTIDPRYNLALEEARSALSQQHEDMGALRTRATSLLTLAGIAAAFLGGQAFRPNGLDAWSYASAVSFGLVVIAVVYINFPRTFTFSNDANVMLTQWNLDDRSADDTARHLAGFLADHVKLNQVGIGRMTTAYVLGLCAFLFEVGFLFVDLAAQ